MSLGTQFLLNKNLQDINPIFAGFNDCIPEQHIIPDARNCTLIHYVVKGCGTFHLHNEDYPVHGGQAFIIQPGQTASYTSDKNDPWSYRWVGFTGDRTDRFSALPPVFDVSDDMFVNLRKMKEEDDSIAYYLAADLFVLYGKFLNNHSRRPNYVQMVSDYIQAYYSKPLSVQEIADHVCLNRYYLSRLFHKKTGRSIQEQILDVRLSEARRYLTLGYSVKETASLCGYSAASIFSKLFKKEYGISPSDYQKSRRE